MNRKPRIKILSLALAVLLIVQIMPFDIISFASTNPHDVYKNVIPIKAVNEKTRKQIDVNDWDKYSRPQIDNPALKDIDYVSASIGSGFQLLRDNNGNLGQSTGGIYKTRQKPINLSPVMTLSSTNRKDWSADFINYAFSARDMDSDSELVIGCNFIGFGSLSAAGQTVSGTGDRELVVNVKNLETFKCNVSGSGYTMASGFYAYIRDNTKAKIESVEYEQKGSTLYIRAKANEQLTFANDDVVNRDSGNCKLDELKIEVTLIDARTGSGAQTKTAYLKSLSYKTLEYQLELGGWANKDYEIVKIEAAPLASMGDYEAGIAMYNMSMGYIYYDDITRRDYIKRTGFVMETTKNISAASEVITDVARNGIDFSGMNKSYEGKARPFFDNTTPTVKEVNIAIAGKDLKTELSDNPNEWPEEIDLKDLYVSMGSKITFNVSLDEKLESKNISDVKLYLNMQDSEGKQIVVENSGATTISNEQNSNPYTVLSFDYTITSTDVSMMSGHEGQRIRPLNLTYSKAEDAAGHKLQVPNPFPAPAQQIYLDVDKPVITVTQLESAENSGYVDVKIDVTDDGIGITGQELNIDLSAVSENGTNIRYVVDTYQNRPANASDYTQQAKLTGDGIFSINDVLLHGKQEYTVYLHILFEGIQTVNGMTVKAYGVSDIIGNAADAVQVDVEAKYDKVAPVTSIESVKVSYNSDKAKVDGVFNASDYNQIAVKQYAWKTNDVPPSDSEWQTADFSGNRGTVSTTIDNGENQTVYFWVRVQDNFGNWSTPIYKTINVQLEKPITVVENRAESDKPVYNPEVIVSGPDRSSDGLTAYTRVTVTMGDKKYARIVSTGESTNIFDFNGTWYEVADDGTKFTSVTTLADTTSLKNYYGEVTIGFENCYGSLNPVAGATLAPADNGTYYKDPQTITVLYAPVQPEGVSVHKVTFGGITDTLGNVIALPDGARAHHFTSEMAGTRFSFSVSNSIAEEWGVNDVDYQKSYLVFEKVDNDGNVIDEAVRFTGISNGKDQSFTVPSAYDNGEEFTSGAYRLKVGIYKNGSDIPEEYIDESNIIVLDIGQAVTPCLWEYSIKSESDFGGYDVVATAAEEGEIASLGLSYSMPNRNIYRDREIAIYTAGLERFNIHIGSLSKAETYYGITINDIEGIRFWNKVSNPTKEELENLPFNGAGSTLNTEKGAVTSLNITGCEFVDSIPSFSEGANRFCLVKDTVNTFYCQAKYKNGTVSGISEFSVYLTDAVPELDISVDSYAPGLIKSDIEDQINVESVTYRINDVTSEFAGEDIRIKLIHSGGLNEDLEIKVNGVSYTGRHSLETEVKVGDLITVLKDSYSNKLSNTNIVNIDLVTTKIVAVDSFGASVCVVPQIGEENRDGWSNSYEYAVNSEEFWSDPWDKTAAERYYIDGSDYGAKYVSYRYYNFENVDKEEEIITTSDENLTYNKYNIDVVEINMDNVRVNDGYYSDEKRLTNIQYSGDKNTVDAFDWETATIEITGDGIDGTVILPYQATAPNAAGLVQFEVYYDSLYLNFANPVTEDTNITEYNREYTIKVKDNVGNDHVFTREYTNKAIHYTDGGASLIDYVVYYPEGVSLRTWPYLSNGYYSIQTNVFKAGIHEIALTDAYGKEWIATYEIPADAYEYHYIPSTTEPTPGPVTVKVISVNPDNLINIEEVYCSCGKNNCDCITIENNGTAEVTVTATRKCYFYIDEYNSYEITNIVQASCSVQWDIIDAMVESDGTYPGTATVYLQANEVNPDDYLEIDSSYHLIDRATGKVPSFTFYPGGETSYTFKANELAYVFGNNEYAFTEDVTVELPVTLVGVEPPTIENEEGEIIVDSLSPEVQLVAYSEQKSFFLETGKALQVVHGENGFDNINPDYEIFKVNTPIANTEEFINAVGWGTAYRFDITTYDMSDVKLFIKEGIDAQAPDYENGISDEIEGVTLTGKRLKVSSPAAFTLFAVDSNNYSTAIPFTIADVGVAPVPGAVKVPVDGEVRIYLTEPEFSGNESASELKIVPMGYDVFTDEDPSSEYYGYDYITVSENGNHSISYSYLYNYDQAKEPEEITGILTVRVFEIRNEIIMLSGPVSWSANANDTATNKSITAKMNFTQNVTSVQAPSEYVDMLDVLISGTDVTVRYDENCPAVTLHIVGANATQTVVDLGEVDNIDKAAPVISLVSKTLSEDGRMVKIVLSSDEKATLTKYNNQGEKADGKYLYTDTAKANGTYTYGFIDAAGNFTVFETEVSGIIDTDLVMEYSLDGTENNTVADPLELELDLGDNIYVRVNRDATIDMNGEQMVNALAQQWVQLTVKEGMANLWPIIRAEDAYGNVVLGQLGQVKLPDTTAPVVDLIQDVIVVKVGTDASEIEKLLTENVVASDLDANLTVKAEYNADLSVPSVVQVTYSVSDSSGNVGTDTGVLRIASNSEPTVKINGETVARDTIYLAKADKAIVLTVETEGEPYSVVYKNGIKSAGQMKIDVTDVVTDAVTDDEITLPFSESGYYTVCIKTQSRDYYLFQIYAE